jgi:hypothetical protein
LLSSNNYFPGALSKLSHKSFTMLPPYSCKLWSSQRFIFFWGEFLRHPDAQRDSQYPAIRSMYETATKATAAAIKTTPKASTASSANGVNGKAKGAASATKKSKKNPK